MTAAWVVGGGGLLGSALRREIPRKNIRLFSPSQRLRWERDNDLKIDIALAVKEFSASLDDDGSWHIYWAAGVGSMGSTEAQLSVETRAMEALLNQLQSEPRLNAIKGCFSFASSAGAIYAGATDDIINENTSVAPTTAYAFEKLKQEGLVSAYAGKNCNAAVILARISTLYGAGQATGKKQGLIAMIARSMLRNQTIQIYVPFDTIRDYITADDAAVMMVNMMNALEGSVGIFMKIIASEQPTTIAEIVSIFKRISRRAPRVVISTSKLSSIYKRRIQFESIHALSLEKTVKTSLSVGIAQVIAAERLTYTRIFRESV